MLLAPLLLIAGLLLRERRRLAVTQAGVLLRLGLFVQVFSSAPSFEATATFAGPSHRSSIGVVVWRSRLSVA
jgi:hypothetical protein